MSLREIVKSFRLHLTENAVSEVNAFKEAFKGKDLEGKSLSWNRRVISFGKGVTLDVAFRVESVAAFAVLAVVFTVTLVGRVVTLPFILPVLAFQSGKVTAYLNDNASLFNDLAVLGGEITTTLLSAAMMYSHKNVEQVLLELLGKEKLNKEFSYHLILAGQGNTNSQVMVGHAYLYGKYKGLAVDEDAIRGKGFLEQAINQKNPAAYNVLAAYNVDQGHLEDAASLYKEAIKLNSKDALFALAEILPYNEARQLYNDNLALGGDEAKLRYAVLLYQGLGGDKDLPEAKKILEELKTIPGAHQSLASYHVAVINVDHEPYDKQKRRTTLQDAETSALQSLALESEKESTSLQVAEIKAFIKRVQLESQVLACDIKAINPLLSLISKKTHPQVYLSTCEIGCLLGHPASFRYMSDIYYYGEIGVSKDLVKAFDYLQQAVDLGYIPARHDYADAMFLGDGCIQDREKAIKIYEATAEVDSLSHRREAINNLAEIYSKGPIEYRDLKKAKEWLQKGIESESDESYLRLADLLFENEPFDEKERSKTLAKVSELIEKGLAINDVDQPTPSCKEGGLELERDFALDHLPTDDDMSGEFNELAKKVEFERRLWNGDLDAFKEFLLNSQSKENPRLYVAICKAYYDMGFKGGAAFVLGKVYADGVGVARDLVKAFAYYKEAYEDPINKSANAAAAADYAQMLLFGWGGVLDIEKGLKILQDQINSGVNAHHGDYVVLAKFYAIGPEKYRDFVKANQYFKIALEKGFDDPDFIAKLMQNRSQKRTGLLSWIPFFGSSR